ncbi:MAG: helix-turn-helix transcriptional regulator [Undibacterium sp.]|nr:helix-turn-helix transcriptional regulator [Opitutaceae bacterium]
MISKNMELASQFKSARARLGLSQSQASQAWKVNLRTLQGWETGKSWPQRPTLQRLWPILFPSAPSSSTSTRKRSES